MANLFHTVVVLHIELKVVVVQLWHTVVHRPLLEVEHIRYLHQDRFPHSQKMPECKEITLL